MSGRDEKSGRFTTQRNTPREGNEEADEIKDALAQVEQERARNGKRDWQWETPMSTINEETNKTDVELEATVEARRQCDELRRELTELELRVKSSGRKLFEQSTRSDAGDAQQYEGALKEVEEMLGAFGDGDTVLDYFLITASLLSYVPVELETWESIIDDWRIKDKNHWCVQKPGVSVREMMFDLRKALKDCRDRLKRINRSKKEPDEEEIVKQMMLAPLPSIKQQMRDKMKWEKLHMEKVDMVTAVRLLVEAEEELGIDESTKELVLRAAAPDAAGGRKQAGAGDVGGKGAGRSNGPPRDQQLENAKAVYAREKGHQKHEVTRAMIENDSAGGIQYWAGKYVDHRKGMHPLAREQDMDLQRKQTDARKQAGGTKLSDKAVDGVKLPAPGGKVGPPVVFQMRASSGWRSQGGSKQPGVHCMRGGDCEQTWSTELVKAVDAVYVKEKLAAGFKAWVTGVRCRKAEGHICEILREWQQQEMQVPTWEQQGDEGVEHEDGSEDSTGSEYEGAWEWWLEPEEGESDEGESEEEQRCDCGAEGDHQCEATVNAGSRCDDCGGICGCTCSCDECSFRRTEKQADGSRQWVHWSERDGADGEGLRSERSVEAARRSYELIGMEHALMLDAGSAYGMWMQIGNGGDEQRRREWHDIGIERTGGGSMEMDVRQMRSEAQRLEYQIEIMADMQG